MKKKILVVTIAILATIAQAQADEMFVDGKVKLGVETQHLLNQVEEEGSSPVFIEIVRNGKNCIVKATAKSIYVQAESKKNTVTNINQVSGNNGAIVNGNGNSINYGSNKVAYAENVLTINARVESIQCDGAESIRAKGWVYDKDGNYGVKSLQAGDVVKIAFDPDFKNEQK